MDWIKPMEPILIDSVIKGEGWIHQVKWDGIRGLCYVDNGDVRLYTKSGRERAKWFPEISLIKNSLNCKKAILDGELIVLDDNGKPSFTRVMSRERTKRQERLNYYQKKYPVQYMVFDILYRDEIDLREAPLCERKKILDSTLKSKGLIHVVSDFTNGEALFLTMKNKSMEGIVSKRLDSPYIGGKKHRLWFKTKIVKEVIAVVCGVKMKGNEVKSLILGEYQNKYLKYIGSVSSGLSHKDRTMLTDALPDLMQKTSPFDEVERIVDVIWIKPVLTVLVSFLERERNRSLRHPVLVGFSNEKPSKSSE